MQTGAKFAVSSRMMFRCLPVLFLVLPACSTVHVVNERVVEGESLAIECRVEAEGNYTIVWYKDGDIICVHENTIGLVYEDSDVTERTGFGEDGVYDLYIALVRLRHAGEYRCVFDNMTTDINITKAEVVVIEKDSYPHCGIFQTGDDMVMLNETLAAGTNITLSCISVLTTDVKLVLKETTEDSELRVEDWNDVHVGLELEAKDDGREFLCKTHSSSSLKETYQCDIGPLNVQYRPAVSIRQLRDVDGGGELIICRADANPQPRNFSWSYNNSTLDDALQDRHTIERFEDVELVHISNTKSDDSGARIKCEVLNDIGVGANELIFQIETDDESIFEKYKWAIIGSAIVIFLVVQIIIVVACCKACKCGRKKDDGKGIDVYAEVELTRKEKVRSNVYTDKTTHGLSNDPAIESIKPVDTDSEAPSRKSSTYAELPADQPYELAQRPSYLGLDDDNVYKSPRMSGVLAPIHGGDGDNFGEKCDSPTSYMSYHPQDNNNDDDRFYLDMHGNEAAEAAAFTNETIDTDYEKFAFSSPSNIAQGSDDPPEEGQYLSMSADNAFSTEVDNLYDRLPKDLQLSQKKVI